MGETMDGLQDEELSDPIEAFAKLSQRVQDGQLDTKRGFAQTQQAIALVQEQIEQALALMQQRAELALAKAMTAAAPDYTDDIKELKRAVQAIEKMPALELSGDALKEAIQGACSTGNAAAISAMKSAETGYKEAQQRELTLIERIGELSSGYIWLGIGFLVAIGIAIGVAIGMVLSGNLAKPIKVPQYMSIATAADCKEIGGTMGQDKEKRPVCHISVRP